MWMDGQILQNKETKELVVYLGFGTLKGKEKDGCRLWSCDVDGNTKYISVNDYKETVIHLDGKPLHVIVNDFSEDLSQEILAIKRALEIPALTTEYEWYKGMRCYKV